MTSGAMNSGACRGTEAEYGGWVSGDIGRELTVCGVHRADRPNIGRICGLNPHP